MQLEMMEMFELSLEAIAIIGFLAGPLGRTLYDWGWELLEDPTITFDQRYWMTMLASMFISFFAGLVECAAFILTLPPEISQWSHALIFLFSFSQGFMISHVINRPLDHVRSREAARNV